MKQKSFKASVLRFANISCALTVTGVNYSVPHWDRDFICDRKPFSPECLVGLWFHRIDCENYWARVLAQ